MNRVPEHSMVRILNHEKYPPATENQIGTVVHSHSTPLFGVLFVEVQIDCEQTITVDESDLEIVK